MDPDESQWSRQVYSLLKLVNETDKKGYGHTRRYESR